MNYECYYENFMYNYIQISQVPGFEVYNITVKLGMLYAYIIKYFNLLFFSEYQRFLIANLTKSL